MTNKAGDWNEAGMMVMQMLEDHGKLLKQIRDDQILHFTQNKVDIAVIKVKLALIGVISGTVSGGITAVIAAIISSKWG